MKTVVIYHRSDFDGIFCREIAKKFLPDAELIGWEYGDPVPAVPLDDPSGRIVCCWKLSWPERLKLLFTGKLWHQVLTFNHPLQPQLLETEKPDMPEHCLGFNFEDQKISV